MEKRKSKCPATIDNKNLIEPDEWDIWDGRVGYGEEGRHTKKCAGYIKGVLTEIKWVWGSNSVIVDGAIGAVVNYFIEEAEEIDIELSVTENRISFYYKED